jgi:hypothetical protein
MKIKKLISCALIVSFLILMFNGLLDLAYGIKQQYIRIVSEKHSLKLLPQGISEEEYLHHLQDARLIQYRNIPLVGHIPIQGNYGIYTIGNDGNRLYSGKNLTPSNPKKKILILGSSQTFGFLNDFDNDLIGQLSNLLPEYYIENFSVPGQTSRENLSLFKYLISIGKKYDLVYVINGPMGIHDACLKANVSEPSSPAISFDIGITKLLNKFIEVVRNLSQTEKNTVKTNVNMCNIKPFDKLVVDDAIGSVEQILDYGNNHEKIKTILIIPPTPYTLSVKLNTENLAQDPTFLSLKPVYGKLFEEFARRANTAPGVYDLTHSLDESESESFIDTGGHLTPQGNKILAQEIKKITESQTD